MDSPIESAVVLPDADDSPPPPASLPLGLKRRQSEVSEPDPEKRVRLSSHGDFGARRGSHTESTVSEMTSERRKSSAAIDVKERTRGKRLFGAFLAKSALSQKSTSQAQERRAEIEKRTRAKLREQAEEADLNEKTRLAKLQVQRKEEQRIFDEESMRIRHASQLHMAHFLVTKSEPRLYYKPWELTPEEEDLIDEQVAEARAAIAQEKKERGTRDEGQQQKGSGESDKDLAHDADIMRSETQMGKENHINTAQQPIMGNGASNDRDPSLPSNRDPDEDHADGKAGEAVNGEQAIFNEKPQVSSTSQMAAADENVKEAVDDNGEEVVEAAEDTVIY